MTFIRQYLIPIIILVGIATCLNAQEKQETTNKKGNRILPEKGDIAFGIDANPLLNLLNDKGKPSGFDYITDDELICGKYFLTDRSAIRLEFRIETRHYKNKKTDEKQSETLFDVSVGYEERTGEKRIQGFYGAKGSLYYYDISVSSTSSSSSNTSRFGIGAAFFFGVEYFIFSKVSLGGQFSWGPYYLKDSDDIYWGFVSDNSDGAIVLLFHF